MEENGLRDLLSKRLYIELQLFKDSMLQREKEDIFQSSYEIEIYVNLYEIFMMHLGNLDIGIMHRLLNLKFGIMEHLYQEWLSQDDSFFDELKAFACDGLGALSELGNLDCREEAEDGKRPDKAA